MLPVIRKSPLLLLALLLPLGLLVVLFLPAVSPVSVQSAYAAQPMVVVPMAQVTPTQTTTGTVPLTPTIAETPAPTSTIVPSGSVPTMTNTSSQTVPATPREFFFQLESAQFADSLVTRTLYIGNAGKVPLYWQLFDEVLWTQPPNGISGIVSSYYSEARAGVYAGNDFSVNFDTVATHIRVYGADSDGALQQATHFSWYILTNGDTAASWVFTTTATNAGITIQKDDVILDMGQAGAPPLSLQANQTYWLVFFPHFAGTPDDVRWYWAQARQKGAETLFRDPVGFFNKTSGWAPLSDLNSVPFKDVAFTVEGYDEHCQGQSFVPWLTIPNPQGVITASSGQQVRGVFDSTGLVKGIYTDTLCILSNDSQNPVMSLQVILDVTGKRIRPNMTVQKTVGLDLDRCATESEVILPADGSEVAYCYTIQNTGDVTLPLHTLIDENVGFVLGPNEPIDILPGDSYSIIQTDTITMNTSSHITWTATVAGIVLTRTNVATMTLFPVVLTTTVGLDPNACATQNRITLPATGGEVTYCYRLENKGDHIFTLHTVDDDSVGSRLGPFHLYDLAPNETFIITHSTFIKSDLINVVTWTASLPGVQTVTAHDVVTVTITPPFIFTTTVGLNPHDCATRQRVNLPAGGGEVIVCYMVRNTGLYSVSNHIVSDIHGNNLLSINRSFALFPEETFSFTQTQNVTNSMAPVLTWSALVTDNQRFIQTEALSITVEPTVLSIILTATVGLDPHQCATTKQVGLPAEGGEVIYCYTIENNSNRPLPLHTVFNDGVGVVLGPNFNYELDYHPIPPETEEMMEESVTISEGMTETITNTVVAPYNTYFFTDTVNILFSARQVVTWTATLADTGESVATSDELVVEVAPVPLVLTTTVGTRPNVCAENDRLTLPAEGGEVVYCYRVQNLSGNTFPFHTLIDNQRGTLLGPDLIFNLAPGATFQFLDVDIVTEDTVHTTTWTASNRDQSESAIDTTSILLNPSLLLTVTVGLDPTTCATKDTINAPVGSIVYYCYQIKNTSSRTFISQDIHDNEWGAILEDFEYSLIPNTSFTHIVSQTVLRDTESTATWTAYLNPIRALESSDTVMVHVNVSYISHSALPFVTISTSPFFWPWFIIPSNKIVL